MVGGIETASPLAHDDKQSPDHTPQNATPDSTRVPQSVYGVY